MMTFVFEENTFDLKNKMMRSVTFTIMIYKLLKYFKQLYFNIKIWRLQSNIMLILAKFCSILTIFKIYKCDLCVI